MFRKKFTPLLLAALFYSLSSAAKPPEVLVEGVSNQLISEINEGRESFDREPNALYTKIDRLLSEFIDYAYISRGVMGKYYSKATPDQRALFQKVFQKTIVELLTKSLVTFQSRSIRVLPLTKKTDSRASVDMEVVSADSKIYRLVYSMVKTDDLWKVRNIIVDGVNLGMTYRNQFDTRMRETLNDIDAVTKGWQPEAPVE